MQTRPLNRLLGRVRRTLAAHQTDDATLPSPIARTTTLRPRRPGPQNTPLVLAACRKVPPDSDADDVFQATFLVLMRTPGPSARDNRSGAGCTAWPIAWPSRPEPVEPAGAASRERPTVRTNPTRRGRKRVRPPRGTDRLPDKYRLPLLLLYMHGTSRDEAAAELGWSLNVVRGQLERGREHLRRRLERRGIGLSAGLLAAILGNSVTAGGPPARLVDAAIRGVGGRPSAAATALAHGVSSMSIPFKATVASLVALAALVVGLWPAAQLPPVGAQSPPAEKPTLKETDRPIDPLAPSEVEVTGRVLDPNGKPVEGAEVTYQQDYIHDGSRRMLPPARSGQTDADGRYRFKALMFDRPSTTGQEPIGFLTAKKAGFGPTGTGAGLPASLKDRTLKFADRDAQLESRVVNLEGRGICMARLTCVAVIVPPDNDLRPWLKDLDAGRLPMTGANPGVLIPAEFLGLGDTVAGTGPDGRLKLQGIGRGRIGAFRIDAPSVTTRLVWIMTDDHPTVTVPQQKDSFSVFADQPVHGPKADIVCAPCTPVEGTVTDQDTGKPVAGATVFSTIAVPWGVDSIRVETKTDGQGWYQLLGRPTQTPYRVTVLPPKEEPYLTTSEYPPGSNRARPRDLDFAVKPRRVHRRPGDGRREREPASGHRHLQLLRRQPELEGRRPGLAEHSGLGRRRTYTLVGLPGSGS